MDVHLGGGELAVFAALLGSLVTALVFVHRLLMDAMKQQLADTKKRIADLESVGIDAVRIMQVAVDRKRELEGLPPVKLMAAVVPEHHSKVSEDQAATALQATLRAAVTAAALELSVDGRQKNPEGGAMIPKDEAVAAVMAIPVGPPEETVEPISKEAAVAAVLAIPVAADNPEKKQE